jgi:ATP synthase protein I
VNRATNDPYAAMLRAAAVPTAVVGLLAVAVAAVAVGARGAVGALLGTIVVVGFFSASLLAMRATARSNPGAVAAAAVVTYVTKVGLLGMFLLLVQDATWLSRDGFALTVITCGVVWLACEVRAFTRLRLPVTPDATSDG